MRRVYIQPYGPSESAKVLAAGLRNAGLDCKRLRYQNTNYTGNADDVVVNWGSTKSRPYVQKINHMLNKCQAVSIAANKQRCLFALDNAGVSVPRWTNDYLQALEWIHLDGITIAARQTLNGHSGEGMVITADGDHLPKAPLYTQFNRSKGEYRVHVFGGEMIDYAKKRRRTDSPPVGIEKAIRSYKNGWIYARKNQDGTAVPIGDNFIEASVKAVKALDLYFGAVDVLNVDGQPVVLEVNTAPGLQGDSTLNSYVQAIMNHVEKL